MYINEEGSFVIKNYQQQKTFSSFLPGIAGETGVPLWVFYVNRGQGIASFGIKDKDHAMMEFNPANKAYQLTPLKGFRTFIKILGENFVYEPFKETSKNIKNKMIIDPYALTLKEVNHRLNFEIEVKYFILPGESFGALVRRVYIKNLSDNKRKVEVLDGIPELIPEGISNQALKEVSQTMSAWCKVDNLEEKVPFFRLKATAEDTPEVRKMVSGHFFLSFCSNDVEDKLLTPLVDPEIIFGKDKTFYKPVKFYNNKLANYKDNQIVENRYPSAMSAVEKELIPDGELVINSLYGHTSSMNSLKVIKEKVFRTEYMESKEEENKALHQYYLDQIFTVSNYPEFDQYCRLTYMDNVLRGGYPVRIGSHIYHLYSRKHGDLERDYNFFQLEPNYYSQGNGNYRDVNQNRRCDNYFNPQVKETNIKLFANLIQADGFNPLVINGLVFSIRDGNRSQILKFVKNKKELLAERLEKEFTPGSIAQFIIKNKIELIQPLEEFIHQLLEKAESRINADHGEGFWIDHWTYLLDLIENYLAVYPEKRAELLVQDDSCTYYDNYFRVEPREKKYVLSDLGPRQFGSVKEDKNKKEMIGKRKFKPNQVRMDNGQGDIFQTNLLVKLLTIVVNKISSLDPEGIGTEMEANKPGWYDALNGLPGIFGSSTPETMELYRLVNFLIEQIDEIKPSLNIPEEIYEFIQGVDKVFETWEKEKDNFHYWDKTASLKEDYRDKVFAGFSGKLKIMKAEEILSFLKAGKRKLAYGIKRAFNQEKGIYNTYYYYLPEEYEETGDFSPEGYPNIKVKRFKQHILPPFLEGQVRAMKVIQDKEKARKLHRSISRGELYDKKLKMYRLNGDLSAMPDDIGRARAFSPGWLENGSIWLHMEYKYILELLKAGLYKDFYQVFYDALIPFQDPERYGRSILENSSFIMSSLNPDSNNHGRGFIARLSGSTAEFIHIWSLMTFGPHPFKYKNGQLSFVPGPVLTGDLFTRKNKEVSIQLAKNQKKRVKIPENSFAFKFLGHTLVIYHNPERKDTFGENKATIKEFVLFIGDEKISIEGEEIKGEYAEMLRRGVVDRLDIYLS